MSQKFLLLTAFFVIFLNGCTSQSQPDNQNAASGAAATANNNTAPTDSKNTTNAAASPAPSQKPADSSPKRIAFNKGANWGAVNITLGAGEAQKFIIGAKSGQTMEVEVSSKETSVNLLKGKAETTEDFGFLNAELQSNGDYVFEVKNSGKKEVKTSVKVTITGGNTKSEKTDTDYVPVDEDDAPLNTNKSEN